MRELVLEGLVDWELHAKAGQRQHGLIDRCRSEP
jgi:hypothetical protein